MTTERAFREWWQESYSLPPGPHAVMTHVAWGEHLLRQPPELPDDELVEQWHVEAMKGFRTNGVYEQDIATQAARWGADAEPEAEGPADEQLTLTYALAVAAAVDGTSKPWPADLCERAQLSGLRAVLARWGRPAARALLAEPGWACPGCEGTPATVNSPCAVCGRIALTQPEPVAEGPTDDEIEEWADACPESPLEEMDPEVHGWRRCFTAKEFSETIRAAIARWGRPAAAPVPEAEGPTDEDTDDNGYEAICRQLIKDLAAARDALDAWADYLTEDNQRAAKYCRKEYESARDAHTKACDAMAILRRPARWGRPAAAPVPEPVGEGPSDQELLRLYKVAIPCYTVEAYKRELDFARAVLAKWGHPAAPPVPEPGEVEGIAEWLNSRGRMADLGTRDWYFRAATLLLQQAAPANALPLPAPEGGEVQQ